jgi:hypothetical protein
VKRELERPGKETVVGLLEILLRNLCGGTEKNRERLFFFLSLMPDR